MAALRVSYHLILFLLFDFTSEIINHIFNHLKRKKIMIYSEALNEARSLSRLVQGECKCIKFSPSLIFVCIEVTGGAEQGTMWVTSEDSL